VSSSGMAWGVDSGGRDVRVIAGSEAGNASVLRRMRAVMGSSAEECLLRSRWGVASIVWAALIALIRSLNSDTLGPSSFPGSWAVPERPALRWSRRLVSSAR